MPRGVYDRSVKHLPVELICQNPDCEKKKFVAPYNKRRQKFCSRRCQMLYLRMSKEFIKKGLEAQRTPEARLERSERMIRTNEKMRNNPYHVDRRLKLSSSNMTKANETMRNDPYHFERRSKIGSRNIEALRQNKDFEEKRLKAASKVFKRLWEDPEYIKHQSVKLAIMMRKRIQSGVFAKAQRLLYNKLDFIMPSYFKVEFPLSITQSIRDKYKCNYKFFLLDIPFVVNNIVIHNFEIDGEFDHSTYAGRVKDFIRDEICLNEFGFPTTRITNKEVFTNLDLVVNTISDIVESYKI